MNVLEQLASDMADAGREAYRLGDNTTDACIAILDEFITGHEVELVGVRSDDKYKPPRRVWDNGLYVQGVEPTTIIVPRKQEPTLLEAAEDAHRWLECFCRSRGEPGLTSEGARDGLAAAIRRARDENE